MQRNYPIKIIIAAGGTGGHLYPAMAIAQMLQKDKNTELLFIGGRGSLEEKKIRAIGVLFSGITVQKFLRREIISFPVFVISLCIACIQSLFIVLKFKPDVVVGMGGYVSGPVVLMSTLCGIPSLIHEQNAIPGLTNKILKNFVKKIGISFQSSIRFFPDSKVLFTGNPVREEVLLAKRDSSRVKLRLDLDKKVVLIFGGSRGARKINFSVVDALKFLDGFNLQILHVTGLEDYKLVKSSVNLHLSSIKYFVYPYLDNMWDALASADLVISRAGATSIAEITARGLPAILIPYPYASDNHQELNSRVLEQNGAAKVILDRELTGENLAREILNLISDENNLKKMAHQSELMGNPRATQKFVEIIYRLSKKHEKN